MRFLLLLIFTCFLNNYLLSNDSLKKSSNIKLAFGTNGFVLSTLTNKSIDPFYHASVLLNSSIKASIGENVSITLRAVSEVWNFSKSYEDTKNMYFWAKPSLSIRVPVGIFNIDTVKVTVADLGRIKHGQGLSLDYFESQGAAFNVMVFKRVNLFFTAFGYGWTGKDDIFLCGISFDSLVAFRFFDNYDTEKDSRIFSSDFSLLRKSFRFYGEIGYNYDNDSKGGMLGITFKNKFKNNFIDISAEYRHYDKSFLKFSNFNFYPYFNSLTSLDKPLNNFRYYQVRDVNINAVASRLRFKYFLYQNFFVSSDLEAVFSKSHDFACEASLGYEVYNGININIGLLNKFFQLYENSGSNLQMFSLHKDIWAMFKVNYSFNL